VKPNKSCLQTKRTLNDLNDLNTNFMMGI